MDKQLEREKYQPEDNDDKEEILMPAEIKPLPKAKTLVNMDKAPLRFKKQDSNADLMDVAEDGEFKGVEHIDVDKAFKANLPHQPVADFSKYQSTAKYRVDLPKD